MAFGYESLYEIELWDMSNHRIADISALATNRRWTRQRNDTDTLTFSLDLFAFEAYAASLNTDPQTLLMPDQTHVMLKRAGVYVFGTQVVDTPLTGGVDSSTIAVSCTGYLDFFNDRYIAKTYTGVERTAIAADMITTTQAQTNGSFGITIGPIQTTTGQASDRTYAQTDRIKLKLQELAQLSDAPFDFDFTYDKKFNTYGQIGSRRTDLNFTWGTDGNVKSLYVDRNGQRLYNKIYGLGSGFGADQLISMQADTTSQLNYYLREDVAQFNSVLLQPTLDQNTVTAVAQSKDLLQIPQITITGKELEGKPFLNIGDRIPISFPGHPWLASCAGLFRIEKMDVTIDENDFESDITLYFDNYKVNQSE